MCYNINEIKDHLSDLKRDFLNTLKYTFKKWLSCQIYL